jgi:hypothetical protein
MSASSTEPTSELVGSSRLPVEVGAGMTTAPTYTKTVSNTLGVMTQLDFSVSSTAQEEDPVLLWLASPAARQFENHWVALDPNTGRFLGLADALPSLRVWQARNAMVLYVDPLPENWSDE